MLSYRHGFHAGNHGDVIKHLCQLLILEKLKEKNKPFIYLDTHSGAGIYDLASEESKKTEEHIHGVSKLESYQGDNPAILHYLELLKPYLNDSSYPGSPELARIASREQDKLIFMELHNTEIGNLKRKIRANNVMIHHRDGLEGLLALLPPKPNRGMVLIDPSYELADDYNLVSKAVTSAVRKWPTGTFAIWYPILGQRSIMKQRRCVTMLEELSLLPVKNLLLAELIVEQDTADSGMIGSGMAIINAPWQFYPKIQSVLSELVEMLGQDRHAKSNLEWKVEGE